MKDDKDYNGFSNLISESTKKNIEAMCRAIEPIRKQQEQISNLAEPLRIQSQALKDIASMTASITAEYQSSITNALQSVIKLPVMDWLHNLDFSPIYKSLQQLSNLIPGNLDKRLFSDIYLTEMYEAKWFPYAGWNAEIYLIREILEILDTTRKSKNRIKKIDSVIFDYYDNPKVEAIKKNWRKKRLPEHIMRMLHQAVQAYHRKEHALTIAVLATLWEGIIYEKVDMSHGTQKQTKESLDKLIEKNEYTEIFKSYYDEFIMYQCWKQEEVKEDVPGRNGIAHGWYSKYPSRKAALNAILFTDFLLALEPLQEEKTNG